MQAAAAHSRAVDTTTASRKRVIDRKPAGPAEPAAPRCTVASSRQTLERPVGEFDLGIPGFGIGDTRESGAQS